MTWYSHLHPTMGLSACAIAGESARGRSNHPHDPSDLVRCIAYCDRMGIDTVELERRMAHRSFAWRRLVAVWDDLVTLLRHEVETRTDGLAPRTYAAMKCAIYDGIPCPACDATGRGAECPKCQGTGRRSGGRCRADRCYRGADACPRCQGHTYIPKEK